MNALEQFNEVAKAVVFKIAHEMENYAPVSPEAVNDHFRAISEAATKYADERVRVELEDLKKMRVLGQVPPEIIGKQASGYYRRGFNAADVTWAENVNDRLAQLTAEGK